MGEEETINRSQEMEERPRILYHASSDRNITQFQPRNNSVRDPEEGPVIFATASKTEATKFLVKTDDSWANLGAFGDVHFVVCADRERFEASDVGGAIYHLPSESFSLDPKYTKSTKEWTSRVPVVPTAKEEFESGLDTMIQTGVQVFFVDRETFEMIQASDDHGNRIIRNLESENMRRDVNVKPIPDIQVRS
jgi:hypothetical protein